MDEKQLQRIKSATNAIVAVLQKVNELKERQSELAGHINGAQGWVEDVERDANVGKDELETYMDSLKFNLATMKTSMKEIFDYCNDINWNVQ